MIFLITRRLAAVCLLSLSCWLPALEGRGGGVTVITHGFNGNVTEWVIPMAGKMAQYASLPGTNVSLYQISVTRTNSTYYLTPIFLDGVAPLASDSGEILIALDWSTLSGTFGVSTSDIAAQAANALLSTSLISDLSGHPLTELPLHLVGHSRGASVMAELGRILGAQGVWVDHLTCLDPYPVSLFGDPSMKLYANVLFVDNYYQTTDSPSGQSLSGAYNRFLTTLGTGGYGVGSAHSDVHLWYHGTADLKTPTSDNLAVITASERTNWWTGPEARGTNTGFRFSAIGGGDRFSTNDPAGTANGIVSGYNKNWNLGAGVGSNRSALPVNNGAWPNLIRVTLTGTNRVNAGGTIPVALYFQFGQGTGGSAAVSWVLDPDANPYNANGIQVATSTLTSTGTNAVYSGSVNLPATAAPGSYHLYARVTDGTRTRYSFAPQNVVVVPNLQPPQLLATRSPSGTLSLSVWAVPGQTVVLEGSTNFAQWLPLLTNTMTGTNWSPVDPASLVLPGRFYRAALIR